MELNNKNKYFQYVVLIFIAVSCYFPVDGTVIEYDEKPVVHCFFTPDKPFVVHVAKTASATDTAMKFFDNAYVYILSNNDTIAMLKHTENGYYENPDVFPVPGVYYCLHVHVPGFEELKASDSIPRSVSHVEYIGTKTKAWISEEGSVYDGLNFIIYDIEGSNYYEFVRRHRIIEINENSDSLHRLNISNHYSIDPSVKVNGTWQAIFSDALFNNTNYTIQMLQSEGRLLAYITDPLQEYVTEIIQGSPTFYKYRITYIKHRSAQYADFWDPMEPVIMYSNIENGYGIFAGYHSQTITIENL